MRGVVSARRERDRGANVDWAEIFDEQAFGDFVSVSEAWSASFCVHGGLNDHARVTSCGRSLNLQIRGGAR